MAREDGHVTLRWKKVLVTGGTSGIGFAAARRFQAEGASIAITGAHAGRLAEAEAALTGVVAIRADAGDVSATRAAVEEAAQRLGGLDIVFANAGMARFAPLEAIDAALFDEQMAVNARAVLFTAQAAALHMPEGGAIVVNTSVNNRMGMSGTLVYAATKPPRAALCARWPASLRRGRSGSMR
jgi:NAD(P)-dependent dehydrogenase (short-subunit alcohol dehydrogenase family)